MSDNTRWQAPGAYPPQSTPQPAPPAHEAPPAAPAPPAYGPPPTGYTTPPAPTAFGRAWSPPPKPGLIPLRPLSFGSILGAPYQALRRNPRPTFGMSLLVQGIVIVLSLVAVGGATFVGFSRLDSAMTQSDQDDILAGTVAGALLSALIPLAFSLVASGVMQAIVVLEVARQTLGEKLTFARLWAMARGRLWAVAGYTVLLTIVLLTAVAVIAGIIAVFVAIGDSAVFVGILFASLLALGMVVVGVWIGTKIAFVPSVMVLERAPLRTAIARSWALTNGRFWYTFGTLLLVAFIINVASSIVTAPLQIALGIATPLLSPTGDISTAVVLFIVFYVISIIFAVVVAAITLVVQSATTVLLYIDSRMRKEGLDLDLARFVEARQAGDSRIRDPFLHA